jgi:hypothetical protein
MELTEVILQHALVTVVIILAGLLVGGGLGVLFAYLLKMLYKAAPGLHPPLMLLPWRTVLFSVVMFFISPMAFFLFRDFEPKGPLAGVYPGLVFVLIAYFYALDTVLNHWLPIGLGSRLVALARTLAVACGVLVAIGSETVEAGIMRYAHLELARTFKLDAFWTAMGIVMGLGLAFDLLLGLVQMLLVYAEKKRAAKQALAALEK